MAVTCEGQICAMGIVEVGRLRGINMPSLKTRHWKGELCEDFGTFQQPQSYGMWGSIRSHAGNRLRSFKP